MASQEDDEGNAIPEPLLAVLRDPSLGKRRLPYLLGLLEEDDTRVRLTASWVVALVAETDDEMYEYVVRRLIDRLDEDAPIEVRHTLDYLAARQPREMDEVLVDLEQEAEVRARQLMYRTGGGFARNEYLARTEGDRPIGRTRIASGRASDDPRRIYTDDGEDEPEWMQEDDEEEDETAEDEDADEPTEGDRLDLSEASDSSLTRGRIARISRRLSTIVEDSRFDDLDVLSDRSHTRYGDVYRTVATVDDDQVAVALTLFRFPEEDRRAFAEDLLGALNFWTEVDDHDSLVTVYDWGYDPRPWAALEYTARTLEDREDVRLREAVWSGVYLADAVAHAHQHGVVHAAIDPENVVYYDNVLSEGERQRPLLANVGLTSIYRHYFDPASVLDPRYAAPEYFDEAFGQVDHATDVYGLGAVLYRLCTGTDPYTGPIDAVREAVVSGDPPAPSDVDGSIPDRLDQIIRKAMATRKLTRYETVNQLGRELRSIETNGW